MILNEIQLPAAVIVSLYEKSLIELPVIAEEIGEIVKGDTAPYSFQYYGENKKNILIIVSYPEENYLPKEQLEFLNAMLNACHLTISDIAVINYATFQPSILEVKKQINPKCLLVFGAHSFLTEVSGQHIEFEITSIEGILTLCVPDLEQVNQSDHQGKILKKRLWHMLKELFDVA